MPSRVFTRKPNRPIDPDVWAAHLAANRRAAQQYRLLPTAFTGRSSSYALCRVCVDRVTRAANEVCGRCRREGKG